MTSVREACYLAIRNGRLAPLEPVGSGEVVMDIWLAIIIAVGFVALIAVGIAVYAIGSKEKIDDDL